jgi:argininosuccinate lyase
MAGVMMSMKGIPTTYNKDMQEDKEPLFNCVSTVQDCIRIAEGVVATLSVSIPLKSADTRSTPTRCVRPSQRICSPPTWPTTSFAKA